MYRQGDVLLVPVAEIAVPAAVRALSPQARDGRGRLVLAHGQVTGHAHAVLGPGRLLRGEDAFAQAWLELTEPGQIVHELHAAIDLPRGWYRVVRQREYAPAPLGVRAG